MVVRMKKIITNKEASGFGVIAVFFPFMVAVVLTAVSTATGDTSTIGGLQLTLPENYENLTSYEREQWLWEQHGGEPTHDFEFSWPIFNGGINFGTWYYTFPDGTKMNDNQYNGFINGQPTEPDYYQTTMSILTLNPPQLEVLGAFGVLIRIALVVSVCIGLVELIWIG